jgi:hypothetical protein
VQPADRAQSTKMSRIALSSSVRARRHSPVSRQAPTLDETAKLSHSREPRIEKLVSKITSPPRADVR